MRVRKFWGETLTLAAAPAFATVKGVPPGMTALMVEVPHGTTFENISLGLCPKIKSVIKYVAATGINYNYSQELTDRALVDVTFNALTSSDIVYVCFANPTRGLAVDVHNANANDRAMTGTYWNGSAWTALGTFTDGTNAGAGTLAQDGLITWVVPTDWRPNSPFTGAVTGFWVKLVVAGTLSASVSLYELTALVANTTNDYGLLQSNNRTLPPYFLRLLGDVGGIEMKSTSLTTACNLTWMATD